MEKVQPQIRSSGIELLRIFCMFLIVSAHYGQYGTFDGGTYIAKFLDAKHIFAQELMNFGGVCCSMFAMITVFFMIEKSQKLNIYTNMGV